MIEKVLLIDDDEISLRLCTFILERNAFAGQVITLANGQQGIDFYEDLVADSAGAFVSGLPVLIFLDINMPILNGWDFLNDFYQKFPQLLPQTKVVILSSSIDPEDAKRAAQFKVVLDFVNKPLNDNAILKLKANKELAAYFT